MTYALLFDVIVCCLLLVSIFYTISLNRKLSSLKRGRGELQAFFDHFSKSLTRAEDGILELRKAAHSIGKGLDEQFKQATALKDDLAFLIERGEDLAAHLDQVTDALQAGTHSPPSTPPLSVEKHEIETFEPLSIPTAHESEDQRLARLLQGLR